MKCVPKYWYKPTPEQVAWAKQFVDELPQEFSREYDGDEVMDKYVVDGWEITVTDDGIYAWDETGTGKNLNPDMLPERVRAAFFLFAAFRASWWPGGENSQGFVPARAIGELLEPF